MDEQTLKEKSGFALIAIKARHPVALENAQRVRYNVRNPY